jgi:hypothetical protein
MSVNPIEVLSFSSTIFRPNLMQKVFKIVSDRSGLDMIVYAKAYIGDTAGYFALSKKRTDLGVTFVEKARL